MKTLPRLLAAFFCLLAVTKAHGHLVTYTASTSYGSLFDEFKPENYTPLLNADLPVTLSLTFDSEVPGEVNPDFGSVRFDAIDAWASVGDTRFDLLTGRALFGSFTEFGQSYTFVSNATWGGADLFFSASFQNFQVGEADYRFPYPLPPLLQSGAPDVFTKIDVYEDNGEGWVHYEALVENMTVTASTPEPATYGAAAAVSLLGLAYWRRRHLSSRV